MKRTIPSITLNKLMSIVLLLAILTMSSASAEDFVTIDTKDSAENEQMKTLTAKESSYLALINQDLNVFQRDQVLGTLGTIYLQKKEYGKALYYLKQVGASWELNKQSAVVSSSSYNLGMIYVHGKGIPKDYPKAFAAFARATWGTNHDASREIYIMCRDEEVNASVIRAFTIENMNYYEQGVGHPLHVAAASNLNYLYECSSERPLLKAWIAKNDG